MKRIVKIPEDMPWEDFEKKYAKFHPISNPEKRREVLKADYERLTGNKPKEEKPATKRRTRTSVKQD